MALKIQIISVLSLLRDDLFWATKRSDAKRMELLLSIGVSPGTLDGLESRGPLHHVASLERPKIMWLLLKHNADIEITDNVKELHFTMLPYTTEQK